MQLPEGFQTNLSKQPTALTQQEKFLLGLVRALLTKSEIFMIYEFPIGLTQAEQENIKQILLTLKKERTILIFSALNPVNDIIDRHFFIKNGNITEEKIIK